MKAQLERIAEEVRQCREQVSKLLDELYNVRTTLCKLEKLQEAKVPGETRHRCPSCGGESPALIGTTTTGFHIECTNSWCGMRGHMGLKEAEAIEWWNAIRLPGT